MTQPVLILRIPAVTIYRSLIARGMKDPAERLPMFRVLDIVNLLVPLESSTRGNDEVVEFRTAIGGVLGTYGSELLPYLAAENISQDTRNEVESLVFAAIPLVLRFMSDPAPDVFMSVAAFVSDLLRRVSPPSNRGSPDVSSNPYTSSNPCLAAKCLLRPNLFPRKLANS